MNGQVFLLAMLRAAVLGGVFGGAVGMVVGYRLRKSQ